MSDNAKRAQHEIKNHKTTCTRRGFLKTGVMVVTGVTLSGCLEKTVEIPVRSDNASGEPMTLPVGHLEPTLPCGDETVSNPEGPFYTKNVPERNVLVEAGMKGTRLLVAGQVLTTACHPIAGALLDFWHADADGKYDNVGFTFRGKQYTDENGNYQLETILPGLYPGRTRHIHVKVSAPDGSVLTTQLYFEGEPTNKADRLIHPSLTMSLADNPDGGKTATFDFVLAA